MSKRDGRFLIGKPYEKMSILADATRFPILDLKDSASRLLKNGRLAHLGNWGGQRTWLRGAGRLETSRPHRKLSFPLSMCQPADEKAERKPAQRG